jgi:hypothetical protein
MGELVEPIPHQYQFVEGLPPGARVMTFRMARRLQPSIAIQAASMQAMGNQGNMNQALGYGGNQPQQNKVYPGQTPNSGNRF